jgi:hypothetical protein
MSVVAQLPEINDPVVLRIDDRTFSSRVEDLGSGVLMLARPLDLPAEHGCVPGVPMQVTWLCPGGTAVLPTRLLDTHTDGALTLWSVAITGDSWVEQRRRFVRVPASGPLTLRLLGDKSPVETVAAHLLDVSEAAVRCAVEAEVTDDILVREVKVVAEFRLDDREFAIPARIGFRRPTAHLAERAELVVMFDEPVKDADALRKQIFALQVRVRRMEPGGR